MKRKQQKQQGDVNFNDALTKEKRKRSDERNTNEAAMVNQPSLSMAAAPLWYPTQLGMETDACQPNEEQANIPWPDTEDLCPKNFWRRI